jgi:hypothetical protein
MNNLDTFKPSKREQYHKPRFKQAGTLADLTQGFAGSVPDEQGGQTKRNPFQG